VLKSVILVLVGGAVGAVLREDMMLWVPSPAYQFPLDSWRPISSRRSCSVSSPAYAKGWQSRRASACS
jgi:hypothetical protein